MVVLVDNAGFDLEMLGAHKLYATLHDIWACAILDCVHVICSSRCSLLASRDGGVVGRARFAVLSGFRREAGLKRVVAVLAPEIRIQVDAMIDPATGV
jgi:hypothetical protein